MMPTAPTTAGMTRKPMTHAIHVLMAVILAVVGLVMEFVGYVDGLLAKGMTSAGIPPNMQTILLIVVAILLVLAAVRLFGTLLAALIVILIVLLVVNRLFPGIVLPHGHPPAWLHPPAQHTPPT